MTSTQIRHQIIAPTLISLLLLTLSFIPQAHPITSIPQHLVQPLSRPFLRLGHNLQQQKQLYLSLPQTQQQNLLLTQENTLLQTQLLLLKNQLHYDSLPTLNWPSQPVKIINLSPLLTVTATDTSSIQPGQPLVDSTSLLGIVTRVEPPLIFITPLAHPNTRLDVQTLNQIRTEYVFERQTPQIIGLPSQTTIPLNTTVYTLPSQHLPEGLVIGTTQETISQPQQPLQKIKIKLQTPLNQSQNPRIITSPNP